MRKLSILFAALLLVPAISQAATLEDLLVEKGVITKAEAKAASAVAPAKVYWNQGTRIEFPDTGFTTKINTQIQVRYEYTDADEDVGGKNTSSFEFGKVRLEVAGTALHEEFFYKVQYDLVGKYDSDGEMVPNLKDAYLGWNACDWLVLRMGQFKTGVSRQWNTAEWGMQFADRSLASNYFNLGRMNGLHGKLDLADGQVILGAGIFNGESTYEGENRPGYDTRHTGVVDLRWNALGEMNSYVEGDVDWTEDPAISLGAAYAFSNYTMTAEEINMKYDSNTISVDANLKVKGFSIHGEIFTASVDPDEGDDVDPVGFYLQTGYFFYPKELELAVRYSMVDYDLPTGSSLDKTNSVDVTVNYYWWKHNLKAQLGYAFLNYDGPEGTDDSNETRWLFQVSSYF